MNRLLIENGTIVTFEIPNRVLAGHALLLEDGLIKAIRPQNSIRDARARRIDVRGKIVMPGLVNAHTHFYSSFARGLTNAGPADDFLRVLRNLWWRLDRRLTREDCHYSALVSGLEAIRHGTTTVFDHHSSPDAVSGSLSTIARAVQETGLRACLCYEVSDRDGRSAAREGILENLRFLEESRCSGGDRVQALFGLHASFTLGERTLRKCVEGAGRLGAGFHIHCAEDEADQAITRKRFGRGVVRRLADHGILGPRTICAHGVRLADEELALLAKTGTALVHNPQSNLNNAVGVMDLLQALRKGVLVGLGTDAMTGNMLEELRGAIWSQRLRLGNPGAAFTEAVSLLVRNNQAIAARYFGNVGRLQEGWAADVICIDYLPPTPMNAESFPGHLVYGLSQASVDTTIVGGRVLMKNRKFLHLDEERITRTSRELAQSLWDRF